MILYLRAFFDMSDIASKKRQHKRVKVINKYVWFSSLTALSRFPNKRTKWRLDQSYM